MLGKLTKHEFRATARIFLPAYLALVLVAVLGKGILLLEPVKNLFYGAISGIFIFIYTLMILGVLFLTFFISVQRFYKNLLGDEGYLMHTLPVKAEGHIGAKLITSCVWYLASGILVVLAILFVFIKLEDFTKLPEFLADTGRMFWRLGLHGWLLLIELIANLVVNIMATVLMFYLSMAIGQLFGKQKLLSSILVYIGLNVVMQIIVTVGMIVAGGWCSDLVKYSGMAEFIESMGDGAASLVIIHGLLLIILFINLLCGAACFLGTRYFLSRKLNLE